jgi:hypothetical protein
MPTALKTGRAATHRRQDAIPYALEFAGNYSLPKRSLNRPHHPRRRILR